MDRSKWFRVELDIGNGWFTDCDFENGSHAVRYAINLPLEPYKARVTDIVTGRRWLDAEIEPIKPTPQPKGAR